MTPLPTYSLSFEKQKHGKVQPETKGKHPSSYQLDSICASDITAAKKLILDLQQYEQETERKVGFLQVLDPVNPVCSVQIQAPVGSVIDKMNESLVKIVNSDKSKAEKVEAVFIALNVTPEERDRIEFETREQSSTYLWARARAKCITASKCHRAISFTHRTSGKALVNEILKPRSFVSADTQFGIEHEDDAINRYKDPRNVTVERCGLFISLEKGFLAASPDGIVTETSGDKGLLEVKALPSFSDVEPIDAYMISKYPVKLTTETINGVKQRLPKLKKNHMYYHQIQLQLYCCAHFASFAEFLILHVNVNKSHYERILPDLEWRERNISKMEDFYRSKVIDELLK